MYSLNSVNYCLDSGVHFSTLQWVSECIVLLNGFLSLTSSEEHEDIGSYALILYIAMGLKMNGFLSSIPVKGMEIWQELMHCYNENDRQSTTCHDIREIMDLQVDP